MAVKIGSELYAQVLVLWSQFPDAIVTLGVDVSTDEGTDEAISINYFAEELMERLARNEGEARNYA